MGRAGTWRTNQAATGAATTPPASMASTMPTSRPPLPSDAINEVAETIATATSAVLTDPTAKRGGSSRCIRNGVTTGPQAPMRPLVMPPAAATTSTPRSSKGGMRSGSWSRSVNSSAFTAIGRLKRRRIRSPMPKSSSASTGRRVAASTLASTVTPRSAPIAPGIASCSTRRWSMLRNRQWEIDDATPVATLARLTVVETDAGGSPTPSRMLELVGPKPMPRAPSTSDAQKPARATKARSPPMSSEPSKPT